MTMLIEQCVTWRTYFEANNIVGQWERVLLPGTIGWVALVAIITSVVSNIALAVDKYWRLMPELRKFQQETIAKSAETLEKLQNRKKEYDTIVDEFTQFGSLLGRAVEEGNTGQLIDDLRERACELLTSSINAHIRYAEFARLYYESRPDALEDFIRDDLVHDIESFTLRMRVLNSNKLLQLIGRERGPMRISRNTTKPWQKMANDLPKDRREEVKEALWTKLAKLLKVGGDHPE